MSFCTGRFNRRACLRRLVDEIIHNNLQTTFYPVSPELHFEIQWKQMVYNFVQQQEYRMVEKAKQKPDRDDRRR